MDINKRFQCWLCLHSLCFWASIYLIISVWLQASRQHGWKSHHQSQLRTATMIRLTFQFQSQANCGDCFLYLHRLSYFVAPKRPGASFTTAFIWNARCDLHDAGKSWILMFASSTCWRHKGVFLCKKQQRRWFVQMALTSKRDFIDLTHQCVFTGFFAECLYLGKVP